MRYRLLTITVFAATFIALTNAVFAADPGALHKMHMSGIQEDNTFKAKIDGQNFITLAALEDYLATLPAGDSVLCSMNAGSPFSEEPDLPSLKRVCATLTEFCTTHHIKFKWGLSYV